ncbi:NDP-sugar epimerase, includes UDP-GlcNAc-inverting 4,6-dehydratase FlaA1 and capsular polysaccharide biosynthesis protein EpsC [Alkalithermobacter thermoalcaliphilus JW-YL-7 = DSM 7308]|uniref:NDP-sugar epimerase, includes UDP-GlcNAc-inverting 4,6-dehydratase FlaA1 and capsular polysaccharide biosynthesis protein EpsC n=1 Tax=Alkalithermobacter thermoalcaliphilus JW-YL-7 = DSM 7308 TaxID=1121328 RepID=A0A150FSH6_CLOPD|nr:polysaccharide biosynthesis protein CapD [[Clostridium] paradoxum JW-YL-7 = DSM 7308]SHK69929.1 NDP-sugar epimerase, includes UDP-GlcNAc-inverting 4,6-dehydratase FlaA1 and capsular polysaccharide biosynthesis protein EpsC [[Clostridium] paradoxum JW-YL-7 = DSM 7308]
MGLIINKIRVRQIILLGLDIILFNLAAIISLELIYNFDRSASYIAIFKQWSIVYTIVAVAIFYTFRCYKSLWRYASIEEMLSIVISSITTMIIIYPIFKLKKLDLSANFYIINTLIMIGLNGGLRFSYRLIRTLKTKHLLKKGTKVLVIGAGVAGTLVIKELFNNPQIKKIPVGIIDDDKEKLGRFIHGVEVLGDREKIKEIVEKKNIDEIIIAIPSVDKQEKRKIIQICKETKCKLKILPGVYEIIDGTVNIQSVRDVEIEDLLGRDPIKVNLKEISGYLKDQVVLVTGGGGSIGSELCRQIARFNPKKLLILDIYENNAYDIQQELIRKYQDKLNLKVIIASVRDKRRMEQIFTEYNPDIVFHAAAHKHVPLMEANPTEAIKNNVFGTLNVAELSDKYNVKRFVLISTDKAVNPTNIMGATKRIAEMIIQTLNKHSKTEFVAVRFGNVLGSNGSVIPLFKKQIAEGGPVTITHPDITRYFMTIPEAVQLVIQAGAMAKGGEIFILDMGDPVKIVDLARDLIKLSGLEPNVDIEIKFTGLRPGEKLQEETARKDEAIFTTEYYEIFIEKDSEVETDIKKLYTKIQMLESISNGDELELMDIVIKNIIPNYKKVI